MQSLKKRRKVDFGSNLSSKHQGIEMLTLTPQNLSLSLLGIMRLIMRNIEGLFVIDNDII